MKRCGRLYSTEIEFYLNNCFLSHPLWDLGVTYALHPWLVGELVVDFLFVIIALFAISYA